MMSHNILLQDAQDEGSDEPIVLDDDGDGEHNQYDDDVDGEHNQYGDGEGPQQLQPDQGDEPGTWQYAEAEFVQQEEGGTLADVPFEGDMAEVWFASHAAPDDQMPMNACRAAALDEHCCCDDISMAQGSPLSLQKESIPHAAGDTGSTQHATQSSLLRPVQLQRQDIFMLPDLVSRVASWLQ